MICLILRSSQALEQNETVPFYVCYKRCHNIGKAMTHILGSRAMTLWHWLFKCSVTRYFINPCFLGLQTNTGKEMDLVIRMAGRYRLRSFPDPQRLLNRQQLQERQLCWEPGCKIPQLVWGFIPSEVKAIKNTGEELRDKLCQLWEAYPFPKLPDPRKGMGAQDTDLYSLGVSVGTETDRWFCCGYALSPRLAGFPLHLTLTRWAFRERWEGSAAKRRKEKKCESKTLIPSSQNQGCGGHMELHGQTCRAAADGAKKAGRLEKH